MRPAGKLGIVTGASSGIDAKHLRGPVACGAAS